MLLLSRLSSHENSYGGLIFQLSGDGSQRSFVRDWSIGLAMENVSQWREVMQTALEAAVIMAVLERLGLIGGGEMGGRRNDHTAAASNAAAAAVLTRPVKLRLATSLLHASRVSCLTF